MAQVLKPKTTREGPVNRRVFPRPLPAGTTGNYVYIVEPEWLGSERIIDVTIEAPEGGCTVAETTYEDSGAIQAHLTGLDVVGLYPVKFSYTTATRSYSVTLYVQVTLS